MIIKILNGGQNFYLTDYSIPVLFNGDLYNPQNGLTISNIEADNNSVPSCEIEFLTPKIAINTALSDLENIAILCYYLRYSNVEIYDENLNILLFKGYIDSVQQTNQKIIIEAISHLQKLNQTVSQKITHFCNGLEMRASNSWRGFGTSPINLGTYTVTSVDISSPLNHFQIVAIANYDWPKIRLQNINETRYNILQPPTGSLAGVNILLDEPLALPFLAGTTFDLYQCYINTIDDAKRLNNVANFRGFPYAEFSSKEVTPFIVKIKSYKFE
jgi:hypothetical protein